MTALVVRYHRGALPEKSHKRLARSPQRWKHLLMFLAGILRLAKILDEEASFHKIAVSNTGSYVTLWLDGKFRERRSSEKIAAARHLLEIACGCPILMRPNSPGIGTPNRIHPV
jgi:hypothetical protein